MTIITYKDLQQIVLNVPTFKDTNLGKGNDNHDAASWAGCTMFGGLSSLCKEGKNPIEVFLELEKEQLTHPDIRQAVKTKLRVIYDEVRSELKRREVDIPLRDESSWQARVSERPQQKSFDEKTGYTREGD